MKRLSITIMFFCLAFLCIMCCSVYAYNDFVEMALFSDDTQNNLKAADGTQYLINGDFTGSFYSDIETSAVMTVSMAALDNNRYALIFFNQTSEKQEITYDNAPPMSKAIFSDAIKISNVASANGITATTFKKYSFSVKVKKGINTVYIPRYEITNDCGTLKYTKNGVKCNSLVCFQSVTFDVKNVGKIVYTADVPLSNISHYDQSEAVDGVFNKSYMGNDEKGYTNYYSSLEGAFISYPFSIDEFGDYFLKVYYAACEKDCPAVMYLDCDEKNMLSPSLWRKAAQFVNTNALDRQAAVQSDIDKFTKGSTQYHSGLWSYTGTLWDYVDNGKQDENSWVAYRKAPYFSIKTFEIKNLSEGRHTASFIVQSFENNDTGKVDFQNNGVLINRIEVVPKNVGVDVNTYITSEPGERISKVQVNGWENGLHHVTVLSDAKGLINDKNANIKFNVEFINNTDNPMVYDCYIAQYGKNGELLSCDSIGNITVASDKNVTVTRTYEMNRDTLNEKTESIKLFVWDKALSPANQPTQLKDYSVKDIRLLNGLEFSESFRSDVYEYDLNVEASTDSISMEIFFDEGANLYVNGNNAENGEETVVSDILDGDSQIVILVSRATTEVARYIINVHKELPKTEIPVSQAQYSYIEHNLNDGLWVSGYESSSSALGLSGVGGGGVLFKFNSPKEQNVKITVNCWRGQPNSDPIVVFFNPIATPDVYTEVMTEGTDYPALSEAKIVDTTWSNGQRQLLNLEMEVVAFEGENRVWLPSRALARNGSEKTIECMYLVNPKVTTSYANRQTVVSSITIKPTICTVTGVWKR